MKTTTDRPFALTIPMRRHPWEMPWKMLAALWTFRVAVFFFLWKANGASLFGASQSLTVQALFDVFAWFYRSRHAVAASPRKSGDGEP